MTMEELRDFMKNKSRDLVLCFFFLVFNGSSGNGPSVDGAYCIPYRSVG